MAKIKLSPRPLLQVTIATAGTPLPLANVPTEVPHFMVQALSTNVGNVYIGDMGVQSDFGLVLEPGQTMKITAEDTFADEDRIIVDVADWYVDAANAGDKVNVVAIVMESVSY